MSNSVRYLYEFEDYRLDPAERLLVQAGAPVPLAPKTFEMLLVLVSNSGRLLTKEELLRAVWADTVVEKNNLDKTISLVRKALGERGSEGKFIETVRGHGYRFNVLVTEIVAEQSKGDVRVAAATVLESPARTTTLQMISTATPTPQTLPVEPRTEKTISGNWQRFQVLLLLVLLMLVGLLAFWRWPLQVRQPEPPREIKVTRLTNGGYIHNAVLSPDGKYFAYTEQDDAVARLWLRQVAGGQTVMLVPELGPIIPGLSFAPDGQAIYFVTVGGDNPQGALYRVPTLGGAVTKLLTGIVSPVTFAPDGQQLAFIRLAGASEKDGTCLVLADKTGGNERIVLTRSGPEQFGYSGPSWSPDGKEIACALLSGQTKTRDEVWRVVSVDVQHGTLRLLTVQQWDGCGRLVWLCDARGLVLVGTKEGESSTTARDAVWFVSQPDGAIRRITTDLNRHVYNSLSVTNDGQALLVIPFNRSSQIWSVARQEQSEATFYDARSAKQLTTGTSDGRAGLVSLADGQLVYVARTGDHVDLWRMNNENRQPQQLTTDPPFLEELSAPPDGRYFVFAAKRGGYSHLFRVNRDASNLQQLTRGDNREIDSACSPDGRWVVYTSQASVPGKIAEFKLWKIPAAGGTPIKLTDHETHAPHFSPDGQWISYVYKAALNHLQVAVISTEGGAPLRTFKVSSLAELNVGCRWTADGQALTYIVKGKTFDNLWQQSLKGNAPKPLTDFNSGEIYNYAFARDGQRLFLARGHSIRDVLLIKDFK